MEKITEQYTNEQEKIAHPIWDATYVESQEESQKENNMKEIEKVEEIMEDFPDTELSESQKAKIESMEAKIKQLKVEEVLRENDARFFGICSTFVETMKRGYLAGLVFKLENATLVLLGNDENEVYYMEVSDLGKLSEDIKYFRDKVLSREGSLNPEFEKVELTFSSADENFRAVDFVESIEITR